MRRFSRGSRRFATVVPARISSYQLVSARISSYQLVTTVYPYDWHVRTFGWYRTSTLIRYQETADTGFKHPYFDSCQKIFFRAQMRAIPDKLWSTGPSASISGVDYKGLWLIIRLIIVNPSISLPRLTRESYISYFTLQISNTPP